MKLSPILFPLLVCGAIVWSQSASLLAQTSQLWGKEGEKWDPAGALPDFSFAGYHFGEKPLPEVAETARVTDFGAVGDGKTDCTEAFKKAIAATEAGAIFIPAGRYLISDILWIEKPNLVLRGEGPDKTVLVPTTDLESVRPNMGDTSSGRPTSNYSWSGGFLWVKGREGGDTLAKVTESEARGTHQLTVADASRLRVGQRVLFSMSDSASGGLVKEVYSGQPGNTSRLKGTVRVRQLCRVTQIEGKTVTVDRPRRLRVDPAWQPSLRSFEPTVEEVGIEHLAIEFPAIPYGGHFTERGRNGIAMNTVANCWVRDVRIINSDSGLFLTGYHCTAEGLAFESVRERDERSQAQGHHGITGGTDCLFTDFDFRQRFIHDITAPAFKSGNVFKNGRGENLTLDHHKRGPHENLFSHLDAGQGTVLWQCGGGADLGLNSGARTTFWAIRSAQATGFPPTSFGPDSLIFSGVNTGAEAKPAREGTFFEKIPASELVPVDLHAAQLSRRLENQ